MARVEYQAIDILQERLRNQRLIEVKRATAHDVVRWLGAVQAQDYGGAKWAVAQRAGGPTSSDVDRELAAGTILRTHVLRPTWHLVTPQDIRWMLALTAPRMRAMMEYSNRQSGLTDPVIARAVDEIVRALTGGHRLTRSQLGDRLRQAGIETGGPLGLGRVMHRAEVDAVVCSGGLRGKQHTYALLDELVPQTRALDREAALATLAGRYFASHGPATIKDFAWWSGLSATDARGGANAARPELEQIEIRKQTYWLSSSRPMAAARLRRSAHLLPNFDEYTVAYRDRSVLLEDDYESLGSPFTLLNNAVVVNGVVLGTWKRTQSRTAVRITLSPSRPLTKAEFVAVEAAAARYGRFLDRSVDVTVEPGWMRCARQ